MAPQQKSALRHLTRDERIRLERTRVGYQLHPRSIWSADDPRHDR